MAIHRSRWALALLLALSGVALAWNEHDAESPFFYRVGVIAVLVGLVWYVAECLSLFWMRVVAVGATVLIGLSLIAVGDGGRTETEAADYLILRESVGSELNNVVRIGDGPAAPVVDGDVETAAAPSVQLAEGALEVGENSPLRRPIGEVNPAIDRINATGGVADAHVVSCSAVEIRAFSNGLAPLVQRVSASSGPSTVVPNNLISKALEKAEDVPDLDALLRVLDATDLTAVLSSDEGPFTIFLPTRTAVERELRRHGLDLESLEPMAQAELYALVEVMQVHAVAENLSTEEELRARVGTPLATLGGDEIRLGVDEDDQLVIGTAEGDQAVIGSVLVDGASNGVIYSIDGLITPQTDALRLLAVEHGGYSHFARALNVTGLAETLGSTNSFTVFAPTDEAFDDFWRENNIEQDAFFDDPLLGDLIARHIVAGDLEAGETAVLAEREVETLRQRSATIAIDSVDEVGDGGGNGSTRRITFDGWEMVGSVDRVSNGLVYGVDRVLIAPDNGTCEPRNGTVGLLVLLRDELIAAATRTTDASTQDQLSTRLSQVESELENLEQQVAVQELVIDGADTLIGGFLDPILRNDVAARLGGWGWVIVAAMLVIAYRWLEVVNGRRKPGPVIVQGGAEEGANDTDKELAAKAAGILKNVLGEAELREPSQIPGSDATKQVAELMQTDAFPGSRAAQVVLGLVRSTAFPRKGVIVTTVVETGTESQPGQEAMVTVRAADARTGELLFAQPFAGSTVTVAATRAAHYVAAMTLNQSLTVAPWARWPSDDGTALGAYQRVARADSRRSATMDGVQRRRELERAVAACPYSGLAHVALGQAIQLVGPRSIAAAREFDPDEPTAEPEKNLIGAALMAGLPHFATATQLYPEFLLGRYRLAASLSMLAEDVPKLWHYQLSLPKHLESQEVTAAFAASLLTPARHRRPIGNRDISASPEKLFRLSLWLQCRTIEVRDSVRAALPMRTEIGRRIRETDAVDLQGGPRTINLSTGGTSLSPIEDGTLPHPRLLLNLASREISSALADLRYGFLRSWRQDERDYWLQLTLDRRLRGQQKASFRVLAEIVGLRQRTLPSSPEADEQAGRPSDTISYPKLSEDELTRLCRRVDAIRSRQQDDAITTYAAACFYGVCLARVVDPLRFDPPSETSDDAQAVEERRKKFARQLADQAIRLVHAARNASNGYVVKPAWVMRDPDLWSVRQVDPEGWAALMNRLNDLLESIDAGSWADKSTADGADLDLRSDGSSRSARPTDHQAATP